MPGSTAALVMAASPTEGALRASLLRRAVAWAHEAAPQEAWLAYAPSDSEADLAAFLPAGTQLVAQRGGTPGERLAAATGDVFDAGADRLLVITADVPRVGPEHARAALADLDAGCDVVIGPKFGGGYYLLGLARPAPDLFELAPEAWAGAEVTSLIFRRVAESGLDLGFLRHERDLEGDADAAAALADPLYPREIVELLRG